MLNRLTGVLFCIHDMNLVLIGIICHEVSPYCLTTGLQGIYVSRALCIIVLQSQGSDLSVILRGLQNIFIFSAYTDACASLWKIVIASKRPLIYLHDCRKQVDGVC